MSSPLERLKDLKAEPPDAKEFAGLKRAGFARLKDAGTATLSIESRFDLAYNAAYSLSLAALRYRGYRAVNRYVVFQVLPHTLGVGAEVWKVLAKAHEVRNLSAYEGAFDADERLVKDLTAACAAVAKKLGELPPLA